MKFNNTLVAGLVVLCGMVLCKADELPAPGSWGHSAATEGAVATTVPAGDDSVSRAIVKIFTVHNVPSFSIPWSMRGQFNSSGSGAIIAGRKILTNAHIVSDPALIQVRRFGEARKYTARVLYVSHAVDLALLTVNDDSFFEDIEPLEIGDLPLPRQEVLVYGFPLGGDTLSVTKGVVSRVEHVSYSHSMCRLLAAQVDAAINPGNSGGPAMIDGRIAGVVMQGMSQADNIGYIVPSTMIRHFLKDIENGVVNGVPSLGFVFQSMENHAMRKRAGMDEDLTGVRVIRTIYGTSVEDVLKTDDIILAIDGTPIANDGTIEFRPKERTHCSYHVNKKQIGEIVTLDILRNGKELQVDIALDDPIGKGRIVEWSQYDKSPSYFIYGGLIFTPLTLRLLMEMGDPNNVPPELMCVLGDHPTPDRTEAVILLGVLAADVNEGYHEFRDWLIDKVNGEKVRNLRHLVSIIEESNTDPFLVVRDQDGQEIVLDRAEADAVHDDLLDIYRVPSDRSPDLLR